MDTPRRRGGLVGPLILIGLGAIFLLNNLGYVNWDIWLILLRLWPLLLVAVGLDILIGRRSLLGSIVVVILVLLLFAGAIGLMGTSLGAAGPSLTNQNISQLLQGTTRAEVRISPGLANIDLASLETVNRGDLPPDLLIWGSVATSGDERVTQDFNVGGGLARYQLQSQSLPFFPFVGSSSLSRLWSLRLTPQVPLDLRINTGVGNATINLLGLDLTSLDLSIGVGQTTVTLPARGNFQGRISGGIGETIVRIPDGLAARIHLSTGLGSTDVPAGYSHQGNVYASPDYDSASDRADLNVSGAIGKVTILLVKSP